MSENLNVNLSTFDRSVNVINTYNNFKNRKIGEQILAQHHKSNAQLTAMRNQLRDANETNSRILQNQIRELELKEEQKFYKSLSYNNNEIIEKLDKITDPIVLNYLVTGFYEKTKSSLVKANDTLEEISDKLFNKQIIEKLEIIKNRSDQTYQSYTGSLLSKIDLFLVEFKSKEEESNNIDRIEYKEKIIKDKNKNNIPRLFGIIILGFLSFIYFVNLFIPNTEKKDFIYIIMPFLIFSIPLFFLLRKDIKWRKNYLNYKSNQNQKREDELLKLQENEKIEDEKTEKRKQMLLTEPSYISIKEINLKHPTLEETASIISDLETNFYKKWGITSEEKSDENVSEKVLNFLKKGEMINATIAYKNENNLTSTNEARKKINKIAKDFKYKL